MPRKVIALVAGKLSNKDLKILATRALGRLLKDLKPEDLADLYAYLQSLKSGP